MLAPANPSIVFQLFAKNRSQHQYSRHYPRTDDLPVLASLVPAALIAALAFKQAVSAGESLATPQTLISWLQRALLMILGFKASCCPPRARASMIWNVISVAGRPPRPPSKAMVGTHLPKSRPAMVDCWTLLPDVLPAEAATDEAAGVATLVAVGVATVRSVVGLPPQAKGAVNI